MNSKVDSRAIVFMTLTYFPVIGGAERQSQALLERWAAQGREVWVLTRRFRGTARNEIHNGVHIRRVWTLWLPGLSWVTLIANAIVFMVPRRHRVGSLWSPMLNAAAFAAAVAARLFRKPLVVRLSASGTGGNVQVLKHSIGGRWLLDVIVQASRAFVALNEESVQELSDSGVPREKIRRLSNGVDLNVFKPASSEREAARQALGISPGDVATLFVGRLDDQKNVWNLIKTWPAVLARAPQGQLLIVGEGSLGDALRASVRDQRLESTVQFFGTRSDILRFYQACDVFILPSYFEGIPNGLLEAMACALPSIVSRVPGNNDLAVDDQTALLVDPRNPVGWVEPWQRLLNDPETRRRLGSGALTRARTQFDMEKVFADYGGLEASLF